MRKTDIEIPQPNERTSFYRFFEMLPGILSWTILISPFILSLLSPSLIAYFVITYVIVWFFKGIGMNVRVMQGWSTMQKHMAMDWSALLTDLNKALVQKDPHGDSATHSWHTNNLRRLAEGGAALPYAVDDIIHAVIVATYNESRETLEPTIEALLASDYNMERVIFILAYEERGGAEVDAQSQELIKKYGGRFMHAAAVMHPKDTPGEVIGKGGNITYAGRWLETYVAQEKIDPMRVVVTTLDSDNRPHRNYLAAVTYTYLSCPDPKASSFQPIPMFTNNIWDAPAPMRVIATGNSFWMVVLSLRPHMLRNFSSHAQGLQSLIDSNFWSVRTIVEDGHQYWRTYFRYNGKHDVFPIFVPIYQDAVLSTTYIKTLKAQFIQMRRWAWGASDVAYVAYTGFKKPNKASKIDVTFKLLRLLEGHISWATAPLILAFFAQIPLFINPRAHNSVLAQMLPGIASRILTVAMFGIILTLFLSVKALPPKPARYKKHRSIFMLLQWIFLPVTSIAYGSFSALNSQTRLIFGKYLGKFDVTEKVVRTDGPGADVTPLKN